MNGYRASVEWYWQETLGEKPAPVPVYPTQISHKLTRYRTRASAVTDQRLTVWAMVVLFQPCSHVMPYYLLTYSMVQSPSWEADWFPASQEIPRISQNPKVHYRTHKLPPPVSILGQPNPVHIPTFHLLEINSNITHPSTPRSPQWSLSHRFPQQDPHPYAPHTVRDALLLAITTDHVTDDFQNSVFWDSWLDFHNLLL